MKFLRAQDYLSYKDCQAAYKGSVVRFIKVIRFVINNNIYMLLLLLRLVIRIIIVRLASIYTDIRA